MNELYLIGKRRTLIIASSVLILSIWAIFFEQTARGSFEVSKFIRQALRFLLTLGLLYAVYQGKSWAKNILIILFSLGAILAFITLFVIDAPFLLKTPFIVMTLVYGIGAYYFAFAKSFKYFFSIQQAKNLN